MAAVHIQKTEIKKYMHHNLLIQILKDAVSLPFQKSSIPQEAREATGRIGSCFLLRSYQAEGTRLVGVGTSHTIETTYLVKLIRSSLGHVATDSSQMTQILPFHWVTVHCGRWNQPDECPLLTDCKLLLSCDANGECMWFSDPWHHLLL